MGLSKFLLKQDFHTFAVFQLDFEIFRTIANFIKIYPGHSLTIMSPLRTKGDILFYYVSPSNEGRHIVLV